MKQKLEKELKELERRYIKGEIDYQQYCTMIMIKLNNSINILL